MSTLGDRSIENDEGKSNYQAGTNFENIVKKSLEFLGFTIDGDRKGGAGGSNLFCSKPYPLIGECKAGRSISSGTTEELIKLGGMRLETEQFRDSTKLIIGAGNPAPDVITVARKWKDRICCFSDRKSHTQCNEMLRSAMLEYKSNNWVDSQHLYIGIMEKLISIGTALTLLGALSISPDRICAEPVNTQNNARQSSKKPAKQSTSIQSASLPELQEGSLVRGDTATPVYVINAGRRRLIPNVATFDVLGYKWEKVVQIPEQQLKAIPELPPILLKNNTDFKDGTLLRGSTDKVYLISLGGRRLIPNPKTFEALGFKAEDVRQISNRQLKAIPEYAPLTLNSLSFKDGTLLKGSLPAVYIISANKRRLIPDEATFKALGYKWENIQTISDRALSAIPELPPISARIAFQDGTLLKGSRAAVYVISSGRRRLIPNAQTFDALGYKWENVQQISDSQLESIPEMPPLPSY